MAPHLTVPRVLSSILVSFVVASMAVAPGASASQGSLPHVSQGPQPGPAPLYRPLAHAPVLQNVGRWKAPPILVSGAAEYRTGEFVYQDYLYDDHGANSAPAGGDPQPRPSDTDLAFGGQTGDVVYPTDGKRFGFNAADLVELRVRNDPKTLAFRFTLNTLKQLGSTAIAVGIDTNGTNTDATDWGHGLGSLGPLGLEHVLFTDGVHATLDSTAVDTTTSLNRNQIEVDVPRSVLDPGTSTWRLFAVTGIADGHGGFAALQDDPDATHPGGAHATAAPPVFNVAFRFEKQRDEPKTQGAACQGSRTVGCGNWSEQGQAVALAARDISRFAAHVDFAELARGVTNRNLVPRIGFMNRILVSHLRMGEGVAAKFPWFRGRLQPYSLYVPHDYSPSNPTQFLLVLHSLSATHNQFEVFSPNTYRDLCEIRYAICLTTESRGPDGWYIGSGEYEVFEAWADVAHRYSLDPDRTSINGYSMGGYGTYRLATRYPDLFARAFPVVGPPGDGIWVPPSDTVPAASNSYYVLDNLRNVPAFIWNGTVDELVPAAGTLYHAQRLDDLGYRFRQDYFTGDHFALAVVDSWGRGRRFLTTHTVKRNPFHVTYRVVPSDWQKKYGLVPNHAYWVWNVQMRKKTGSPPSALVDATSRAFGYADPAKTRLANAGPNPLPHVERGWAWEKPPKHKRKTVLDITLENVKSVTIGLDRAGIHGNDILLNVKSDGPGTVHLVGAGPCLDGTVFHIRAGEQAMGLGCTAISFAVGTSVGVQGKPLP
jgi:pimeloyl-ACP methyl ester carboxylesterase